MMITHLWLSLPPPRRTVNTCSNGILKTPMLRQATMVMRNASMSTVNIKVQRATLFLCISIMSSTGIRSSIHNWLFELIASGM